VLDELDTWRAHAIPDETAPLEAEDLVRLLGDLVAALRLERAIAAGFTVNTVHYYRRKDIIDPPAGRTAAARYALRHVWQVAGARLAGYLGLVTLAEAREAIRDADETALRSFLAARVADARARDAVRTVKAPAVAKVTSGVRPLPASAYPASQTTIIPLPGDAWCVVPAAHAAHRSSAAAKELVRALATALRTDRKP
jgi:hypothetical protein